MSEENRKSDVRYRFVNKTNYIPFPVWREKEKKWYLYVKRYRVAQLSFWKRKREIKLTDKYSVYYDIFINTYCHIFTHTYKIER